MAQSNILEITKNAVKFNDMVISVSNISSMDIKKITPQGIKYSRIPFEKEKDGCLGIVIIFFAGAAIIGIVGKGFESVFGKDSSVVLMIGLVGYVIYRVINLDIKNSKAHEDKWSATQERLSREWDEFDKQRIERESSYALEIFTNSGKQTLFSSDDEDLVRLKRDEILQAIESITSGTTFIGTQYKLEDNKKVTSILVTNNYNNYPRLTNQEKDFLQNNFDKVLDRIGKEIAKNETIQADYDNLIETIQSNNPSKTKIGELGDKIMTWCKNNKSDIADLGISILSQGFQLLIK